MKYVNRPARWYCLALVVFAADQTAKTWIHLTTLLGWSREVAPFFSLVHVLNPGAAFSFLAGAGGWQRWFFLAIAFGVSAGQILFVSSNGWDACLSLIHI